jgi:isoamylase
MILGGDEMGRTQQGNNNAYCQDSPIAWFDWQSADRSLLAFARRVIHLRRDHPVFRRRRFLTGSQADEIQWFTPAGHQLSAAEWNDPEARAVTVYLDGSDLPDVANDGTLMVDDDFLVMINGWWEPLVMRLPDTDGAASWVRAIDTFDDAVGESAAPAMPGAAVVVGDGVVVRARSIVILRGRRPPA